jgi:hypothetical protein
MPLEPGPFLQLNPADVAVTPGVYDFTADAEQLQGELNAIGVPWDALILDMVGFSEEPWDVDLGIDLGGMLNLADVYGASMPPATLDDAVSGWFTAQDMLTAATAFAPAQAWTDPGAPFTPPDSALTLAAATVNPEAFVAAANFTVGGVSQIGDRQVSLENLTRVGSQNFVEGDQFQLLAFGSSGDDVQASGTLNGADLGTTDYGAIDSTGKMTITGVMGPDVVGVWSQQWYIGGTLLADFNFVVAPAAG